MSSFEPNVGSTSAPILRSGFVFLFDFPTSGLNIPTIGFPFSWNWNSGLSANPGSQPLSVVIYSGAPLSPRGINVS